MKIPKTIKIAGMKWRIVYDENVMNESDMIGSVHFKSQTIFLDPKITAQQNEETFLHEILHVIWYNAGLRERFKGIGGLEGLEEELVIIFTAALYQIFKDNKLMKEE